ncbi:hypothetical protein M0657_007006 [Pyricularia oryzae]|uniref:Uncharacterized protein n=2 Tax=Pyricularia oryzae TaxID=318829 RepID=A0AA97PFQ1_PYRO3|nr:hypothetical protein OOU_Y34scaffold01018g30 [Pyricularia oryzae Y34]KAI7919055.1 hypothetical protein M9X92_006572 [Pyricularia oryzae]KAI7919537.1 hypothetical protein M0657_007006 [Pyricularia oryzae]
MQESNPKVRLLNAKVDRDPDQGSQLRLPVDQKFTKCINDSDGVFDPTSGLRALSDRAAPSFSASIGVRYGDINRNNAINDAKKLLDELQDTGKGGVTKL